MIYHYRYWNRYRIDTMADTGMQLKSILSLSLSLVGRACNLGDYPFYLCEKVGPHGGAAAALWASVWAVLRKSCHCRAGIPELFRVFLFLFFLRDGTVPLSWVNGFEYRGQFSVRNTKSPEHVSNPKHSFNLLEISSGDLKWPNEY